MKGRGKPAVVEGNIAKIPLSGGGYSIVDAEFAYLAQHTWYSHPLYRYALSRVNYVLVPLHHMIIGKPEPPLVTDHINHDRLDNRACNLRHVSRTVNNQNLGARKTSQSGYGGITWDREVGKWRVQVGKVNGKSKHIGTYAELDEALSARLSAETIYFEEYQNA